MTPTPLQSRVGLALPAQIGWSIVSALWNAAGFIMIANGQPSPGPAASPATAIILLAIAIGFFVSIKRWPVIYVLLSILTGLLGGYAIFNAFTADPALWPSDLWRYGGVAINSVAMVCGIWAVTVAVRWRRARG